MKTIRFQVSEPGPETLSGKIITDRDLQLKGVIRAVGPQGDEHSLHVASLGHKCL